MNTEDRLEFKEVQILAKQNTEAIKALTLTVTKLSEVVSKEDGRILEMISELKESNLLCKKNQEMTRDRISIKSKRLDIIESELKNSVSKKDFEKLTNRLWSIGGAVIAIMLSMLGFLIKLQIQSHP